MQSGIGFVRDSFDAHTDLRQEYLGETLSHATVMRRVWDLLGDGRIYQFGIRSGERAEFQWAQGHVFTNKFNFDGLDSVMESFRETSLFFH